MVRALGQVKAVVVVNGWALGQVKCRVYAVLVPGGSVLVSVSVSGSVCLSWFSFMVSLPCAHQRWGWVGWSMPAVGG